MNVVDSAGWLEYFANGRNAGFFAPAITHVEELVVPTISLYEVFKRILQQQGEPAAQQAVVDMAQGLIVDLDLSLALSAAKISDTFKLPMADSIILATARAYNATLWTQDADLQSLPDVRYVQK